MSDMFIINLRKYTSKKFRMKLVEHKFFERNFFVVKKLNIREPFTETYKKIDCVPPKIGPDQDNLVEGIVRHSIQTLV